MAMLEDAVGVSVPIPNVEDAPLNSSVMFTCTVFMLAVELTPFNFSESFTSTVPIEPVVFTPTRPAPVSVLTVFTEPVLLTLPHDSVRCTVTELM